MSITIYPINYLSYTMNSEDKSNVLLPEMKKEKIISLYVPNKLACFFGCRGRETVGQVNNHGFLELDHLGLHSDTSFNQLFNFETNHLTFSTLV